MLQICTHCMHIDLLNTPMTRREFERAVLFEVERDMLARKRRAARRMRRRYERYLNDTPTSHHYIAFSFA